MKTDLVEAASKRGGGSHRGPHAQVEAHGIGQRGLAGRVLAGGVAVQRGLVGGLLAAKVSPEVWILAAIARAHGIEHMLAQRGGLAQALPLAVAEHALDAVLAVGQAAGAEVRVNRSEALGKIFHGVLWVSGSASPPALASGRGTLYRVGQYTVIGTPLTSTLRLGIEQPSSKLAYSSMM